MHVNLAVVGGVVIQRMIRVSRDPTYDQSEQQYAPVAAMFALSYCVVLKSLLFVIYHVTCRDIFVTIRSAEGGELDCLTYAHENGCRWDERTCTAAARNQHLKCLTYLHENGCPWNYETLLISNGPCRRYAVANNCPKFS